MAKNLSKAINLLDPVGPPIDIWDKVYDWMFNVGKYLLITVEVVVLAVFFSRFFFDRQNNELGEEVNSQVAVLNRQATKNQEIEFRRVQDLGYEIQALDEAQVKNSLKIATVQDSIPALIELNSFSYNDGRITMSLEAPSYEIVTSYLDALDRNPNYTDVKPSINRNTDRNSAVQLSISFVFIEEGFTDEQ